MASWKFSRPSNSTESVSRMCCIASSVAALRSALALIVLALRIRDEEKLLREELTGYREYTQKVRYRLMPLMW